MQPSIHIKENIVLLGAGNAHLQVVRWWRMNPIPGVRLTLVNDTVTIPYSGMIPGCIAGHYTTDEITIDIGRLCAAAGVEFVQATATALDPEGKRVQLEERPAISYDTLSLNLGSKPLIPKTSIPEERQLSIKPLGSLMQRITQAEQMLEESDNPFPVIVVGAGAGGFEVCLALQRRWQRFSNVSYTIISGADRILPSSPPAVSRACEAVLEKRGIFWITGARISGGNESALQMEHGDSLPYALCVWATGATPLDPFNRFGLKLDHQGFLTVEDTLQIPGFPDVFATGDCASLTSCPDLPKAGIFSVREGAVLWKNLQAHLAGEELRRYRPQPLYLFLLDTSDGQALMSYGRLAAKGFWAHGWKEFIDRRWMQKFFNAYSEPMQPADGEPMRCGGCGAKLGAQTLRNVLQRLDIPKHPDVITGAEPGDDAAVHRVPPGRAEVQSVDFFREFVSDPFLLGQIAAINALSDLYAMNADPFSALAIVTVPYASQAVQEERLYQVLSGTLQVFHRHDVALTGGHTSESSDFQIGFAVTGYAPEEKLFRKDGLQPGDALVLTKPLGSGALLRAHMLGQCPSPWYESLIAGLLQTNRVASEVFAKHGVHGCTDITGFGFGGHVLEMLDGANLSARIAPETVPLYPGFRETAGKDGEGIVSTLHEENEEIRHRISWGEAPLPPWLFDPQTSGGLLAGVHPDKISGVLQTLRENGYGKAAHIGFVTNEPKQPTIQLSS